MRAVGAETPAASETEEAGIRAAANSYAAAVRRGDLEAISKMWTPDGDYIDSSGQTFKAHELIRNLAATVSSKSESAGAPVPKSSLRFITPEVAIEDGSADCGLSPDGCALTGRMTAVWVKREGGWLLDSLREAVSSSPSPNDRLQSLSWLLGEWVGTTDDAAILVSAHWSSDNNYIIREFSIRVEGSEDVSATQRIGWDSSAGKFTSWAFDSQGGASEGIWRRDGERWVVDSTEVLANGKKSKTSAIYVPGDDGHFISEVKSLWDTEDAKAADVNLPRLRAEFKRAQEN
jgi:uncharacterized protein (TIGR02246 family)